MSIMHVAVIGAGPAGIYTADILTKMNQNISVDIFDRYPAPFGLIRYGVAPDHPRIKGIVTALHKIMENSRITFFGNVNYGSDISLEELKKYYHAIIFATGAVKDVDLNIEGVKFDGSYGAADFVSWFNGHPDVSKEWTLNAQQIAILGNGNVALDIARILIKNPDDLLSTEIPENVYENLKKSPVTDVHIFGRRGPAQIKFTPLELRELGTLKDVDIVLYPEDFDLDDFDISTIESNNQMKTMMKTLQNWIVEYDEKKSSRRLHLHFLHNPVAIKGKNNKVSNIVFSRNKLIHGNIETTKQYIEYPCQAVYRAIGYFGSQIEKIPFDAKKGIIPNKNGRILDEINGLPIIGLYTTGWIKRGPVGLIGHTKSDALETVKSLIQDIKFLPQPQCSEKNNIFTLLKSKNIKYTNWHGWLALDKYEKYLGSSYHFKRERIKVISREKMIQISSGVC